MLLVASLSITLIACSSPGPSRTSVAGTDTAATTEPATETATVEPATSAASSDPSFSTPGTAVPEDAPQTADISVLAAAGLSIVPSEDQPVDPAVTDSGHLMVTTIQARRMVADVSPESGILGADLDAMITLPADLPSLSYLVAGWVSSGKSASATTARGWMGDQDWTHAPTVHFPLAVLAMFVTELSVGTSGEMPRLKDPLATPTIDEVQSTAFRSGGFGSAAALAVPRLANGPCTAVTQFISQSITGIFNALRITAPAGDGVFASIGQVLAGVVNFGLSLAQSVVEGLVSAITAPVLNLIAIAVGALGVVTVVASFFKDTTLSVRVTPSSGTRFSVGQENDIKGEFIATAKDLTGDWPPVLKDCAKAAGASLPELLPAGIAAQWVVEDRGLIVPGSRAGVVDADRSAHLTFVTGRETKEAAEKGAASTDGAFAMVRIPRKEVDAILDFARSKVSDAQASILNKVPVAVRGAAMTALNNIVNPTLDQLQGEVSQAAGGVFSLTGKATVFVLHHGTPETTTSSSSIPDPVPPDTAEGDDFCTQFEALVVFVRDNPPGDVVAWATEIVNRLNTMRPIAPAEVLGDVDVFLRVYSAVAASADVRVLIQTTEPLPDAAAHVGAFCGLSLG